MSNRLTSASSGADFDFHPQARSALLDVPMPKNEERVCAFQFMRDQEDIRRHYRKCAQEAVPAILGPMPVRDFLDEFLPRPSEPGALSTANPLRRVTGMSTEDLVNVLNGKGLFESACPGFVFDDAPMVPHDDPELIKSYIYCYSADSLERMRTSVGPHAAHLGFAEFFIEVRDVAQDLFADPLDNADPLHHFITALDEPLDGDEQTQEQAQEELGRHVARVAEACARQYRAHYFSVLLAGPSARLIRWDRAGAIVTEAFDIREDPYLLYQFTQKYACASDEERGLDTTITAAHDGDQELFRTAVTSYVKSQLSVDDAGVEYAVSQHYKPGKVVAVTVNSDDGARSTRVVMSRPVVAPSTLVTKATRGYWAVDPHGNVVFLKDLWRYSERLTLEGDVIELLGHANVKNVPRVVQHGNVPGSWRKTDSMQSDTEDESAIGAQHTLTDEFEDAWWVYHNQREIILRSHIHYRLILDKVGYPLKRLTGTKELLHATLDAYEAMVDANEAGWLHRDISSGNIILVREGQNAIRRGYLVDWEMAGDLNVYEADNFGTFPFKSWRLLEGFQVLHTFEHDMESMLWVVLYCSLAWLPSCELSAGARNSAIHWLFDDRQRSRSGRVIGGRGKWVNMHTRQYTSKVVFSSEQLQAWLTTVMDMHAPLPGAGPQLRGQWEGMRLLRFWRRFMERESQSLPGDDRRPDILIASSELESTEGSVVG